MATGNSQDAHTISSVDRHRMRQAAELLLRARRELLPIENLPDALRPRTLDEAYALQDIVAEGFGIVGGWKVGAPSPDATPGYAPMPLFGGYATSGAIIKDTYRRLRGVEAEIAFCLGKDLPTREQSYSREEVEDAIASAHPAIELLESAFTDPEKADRLSVVGDLQVNGGFVYGPAFADWKAANIARESVTVTVDGVVRFDGTASNTAGTDLVRLVTWLANEAQYRTGGLKAGDWITTGSWCGKFLVNPDSEVQVTFSTFGSAQIYFA